jgi:hypothetical protein
MYNKNCDNIHRPESKTDKEGIYFAANKDNKPDPSVFMVKVC